MSNPKKILVTGATGYIGARLVPRLLKAGYHVKAVSRSLEKLQGCHWASEPNLELAAADVLDEKSLLEACNGCDIALLLSALYEFSTSRFR